MKGSASFREKLGKKKEQKVRDIFCYSVKREEHGKSIYHRNRREV